MTNNQLIKEYKKLGYETVEKRGKQVVLGKESGDKMIYQLIEGGKTLQTRSKLK